jgi:RNase P/RNase MRP subunit p30
VYTILVKNITLTADEQLIEQARKAAADRHTTLNAMFRDWLEDVAGRRERLRRFDEAIERTKDFSVDRKYTREEMNER